MNPAKIGREECSNNIGEMVPTLTVPANGSTTVSGTFTFSDPVITAQINICG
jgi:hypothetical protein